MNRYDILALIAMIAVPLAPAFFFGHAIYTAVIALPAPAWLAVAIGGVAALGLELVGILAGHVATTAWHNGSRGRAAAGAGAMAAYVAIGVWELWGTIGAVMFLIAPLVYLLAALQDGLKTAVTKQATAVQQDQDHTRQMDLLAARHRHEERMARIEAKTTAKRAVTSGPVAGQIAATLPADYRLLTEQQKALVPGLSSGELQEAAGISASTARRWKRQVAANGHKK